MEEISFEEFKEIGGSPMISVASDERTFFDMEGEQLGVFARTEEDDGTVRLSATVARPSSYFDGQYRTDDSNHQEAGRNEERAKEKVMDWLESQE